MFWRLDNAGPIFQVLRYPFLSSLAKKQQKTVSMPNQLIKILCHKLRRYGTAKTRI